MTQHGSTRDVGTPRRDLTPFFIAGAPRSGSTYLYYILKSHRRIALTNEARIVDGISLAFEALCLPYGIKSPGSGIVGLVSPEAAPVLHALFLRHANKLLREYYEAAFGASFSHYGDKLPDPYAVTVAARVLPKTLVILIVRDPRDVVCSFQSLQRSDRDLGPRQAEMAESTLDSFARLWVKTNQILLDAAIPMHRVDYVDLVLRPHETTKGILDYLGLEFTAEIETAIASNDTIAGHGTSRTASDSIGRWRRDLSDEDLGTVLGICAPMMARLGIAI